jgi:hypothetical protein
MAFLTAAPFVFDPNRKIFDMGRSKIWTPPPPEIATPAVMGDYIELGPYIDRSIAMMLAQFNEQMEQTVYEAIHYEGLVLPNRRKPSVQTFSRRSQLP